MTDLQTETEDKRSTRLPHERMLLDEARKDVRAGRVIADEDVNAWLDRFVRGESLGIPATLTSSHTN